MLLETDFRIFRIVFTRKKYIDDVSRKGIKAERKVKLKKKTEQVY